MAPFLLAQSAPQASPFASMIPIALIFLIFYFLILQPNAKRQKEHRKLLENLEKGMRVVTSGGLLGTIAGVRKDRVALKLADNVKVDVLKENIARLYESPKNND